MEQGVREGPPKARSFKMVDVRAWKTSLFGPESRGWKWFLLRLEALFGCQRPLTNRFLEGLKHFQPLCRLVWLWRSPWRNLPRAKKPNSARRRFEPCCTMFNTCKVPAFMGQVILCRPFGLNQPTLVHTLSQLNLCGRWSVVFPFRRADEWVRFSRGGGQNTELVGLNQAQDDVDRIRKLLEEAQRWGVGGTMDKAYRRHSFGKGNRGPPVPWAQFLFDPNSWESCKITPVATHHRFCNVSRFEWFKRASL